MTLLSPLALALAAVAIPIVMMYMLRVRRREHVVPSTFLWRKAAEDVQTSPRWRRVRPNLLLFLQLAILAALVLALAQPAYTHNRTFNGDVIAIVDQSLTMQAGDVGPSRLVEAQRRARQLAAELPEGSVMSVIGMGAQPRLLIAESADPTAINRAIDELAGISSPPNFSAAVALAGSLARQGARTQIVVYTSRDSGINGLPDVVPVPVEVDRIGGPIRDLGISAFQGSRNGAAVEASVRIQNFGRSAASSDLQLFADGQLIDVRPLSLPSGAHRTESWTRLPQGLQLLEAQLTTHDDISVDKAAWTVVPRPVTNRVLLVTPGDYFLQTALALVPGVKLTVRAPGQYTPATALVSDLVIFDRVLPGAIPSGAVLLVGPPAGHVGGLRVGQYLATGPAASVPNLTGGFASLLRYVDLSDVHIARARRVTLPAWMQSVMVSRNTTLLAAGEDSGRRFGVITFNLEESDWPLRLSFPVVVRNLLSYLEPGLTLASPDRATGQSVELYPGPGTTEIQVRRPDGRVDTLRAPFLPFTDTGEPGLYTAHEVGVGGERTVTFAVNAVGARVVANGSLVTGGPDVLQFGRQPGPGGGTGVPVDLAWAFGLVALAFLSAEWWYGFRR